MKPNELAAHLNVPYYVQESHGGFFILRMNGRNLEERMVAFCLTEQATSAALRLLAQ